MSFTKIPMIDHETNDSNYLNACRGLRKNQQK